MTYSSNEWLCAWSALVLCMAGFDRTDRDGLSFFGGHDEAVSPPAIVLGPVKPRAALTRVAAHPQSPTIHVERTAGPQPARAQLGLRRSTRVSTCSAL